MKIKLPAHFTDVTLREYVAWKQGNGDSRVSVFVKDVHKMQLKAKMNSYNYLLELIDNEVPQHFKVIKFGDKKYGFINDWDALTSGEYADLDTYSQDMLTNAHKIMSILYRPVVRETEKGYEIEEYHGTMDCDKWWDIPASYYLGALLFFSKKRSELLKTSLQSLVEVVRAMLSTTGGVGMSSSSPSQGRTSRRWTRLRRFQLGRRLHTLLTSWIGKGKRVKGLDK